MFAHPLEHPYLNGTAADPPGDPPVGGGMMSRLARLYPTKPVDVGGRQQARPHDGSLPALAGWRWLHAPAHSVGHVALWREADRALVAGDAVCTTAQESAHDVAVQEAGIHGPPMYFTVEWAAAAASVASLAALEPELLVSFHGQPMPGARMREALHRLAARHGEVAVPEQGRYLAEPRRAGDGSACEVP